MYAICTFKYLHLKIRKELLRKEKNKYAKLESKLRDLEKEKVGLAKVDTGYRARSYAKSISSLRTEEEVTNPEEVGYK